MYIILLYIRYTLTSSVSGTIMATSHAYKQIPARCPLFSNLDRANDYAHSPIVALLSPPRLSCALRPTQRHKVPSLTPGCRWYALRSLSSISLSSTLCRRQAAGEQYATARPPARGKECREGRRALWP